MCRFIAYIGNPLVLDEVLFKPNNSLIKQSVNSKENKDPLNGDGFGLGWYAQDIDFNPAIFRSIQPAWNDLNLQHLASKLRSNCFFAHVRSASRGHVSQFNCHPFNYKQYLFMHNGDIGDFDKIVRELRHQLSDEIYNWIQGQTDSEHIFALFLQYLNDHQSHINTKETAAILLKTIYEIKKLKENKNIDSISKINAVITDGKSMIAVRYSSDLNVSPETLYYASGSHYEYHDHTCHIKKNENGKTGTVIIASEKLTNYNAEWHEIPPNHFFLVFDDLSILLLPIHE